MSEGLVCNFSNFSEIISIKTNHRKEVQREWTFVRTQKGYFISEISLRKKSIFNSFTKWKGKNPLQNSERKKIFYFYEIETSTHVRGQ